ncbi:MAG: FAD:protein FMN transferase [Planctomycetaceae bacterium]
MATPLRILVSAAILLWIPSIRTVNAAEPLRISGETMGTYYAIVVDSPALTDDGEALRAAITQRLAEINRQMSTWDAESEISRFNASRGTDWFPVSAELVAVVQEAGRIHALSNGAFDPTVSPLIDLWGFGDRREKSIPTDEQIRTALGHTGMTRVETRPDPPAIRKQHPAIQLNLSAIAKGYGVDAIAELIIAEGQPSFVVDIGGETRAGEAKSAQGLADRH